MGTIRAIPTTRKGFKFRSRTEARLSVFLDFAKLDWYYEIEGFVLRPGPYLPDFFILGPDPWWLECKGEPTQLACDKAAALALKSGRMVVVADQVFVGKDHRIFGQRFMPDGQKDQVEFVACEICDTVQVAAAGECLCLCGGTLNKDHPQLRAAFFKARWWDHRDELEDGCALTTKTQEFKPEFNSNPKPKHKEKKMKKTFTRKVNFGIETRFGTQVEKIIKREVGLHKGAIPDIFDASFEASIFEDKEMRIWVRKARAAIGRYCHWQAFKSIPAFTDTNFKSLDNGVYKVMLTLEPDRRRCPDGYRIHEGKRYSRKGPFANPGLLNIIKDRRENNPEHRLGVINKLKSYTDFYNSKIKDAPFFEPVKEAEATIHPSFLPANRLSGVDENGHSANGLSVVLKPVNPKEGPLQERLTPGREIMLDALVEKADEGDPQAISTLKSMAMDLPVQFLEKKARQK